MTLAPDLDKALAIPNPIPLNDPVTKAVFPLRFTCINKYNVI
jgi:hypothetical protein